MVVRRVTDPSRGQTPQEGIVAPLDRPGSSSRQCLLERTGMGSSVMTRYWQSQRGQVSGAFIDGRPRGEPVRTQQEVTESWVMQLGKGVTWNRIGFHIMSP